ncbi:hypothetical protein A5784_02515 [Mycobacterium sp. 852013-50091_SCH5140682]|uniref:amidase domain-containing protein n=1 Tax=Mycobacterium sp. 852013-50091_SCH5140682 TaxID=1834109 RepID=UPI0007E9AA9B|nr:amidase domain-containing protein [Mycobacterium sp. 852013-50091_SCH5140682]OBC01101.1 hypothetical protein A5784_02515 [Mycobacterium sp. 852013-50091_SCH5140682]
MTAVTAAATLTRADVEAFDVAHLEAPVTHWTTTARRWESTFESLHTQTVGTTWEGAGADAAAARAWDDVVTVRGAADCLHAAASAARHGAGDLIWAKRQVLDTIEEAEAAGFTVGQDFSVTDQSWSMLRAAQTRQAHAKVFAAEIAERVQNLARIDGETAAKITAALAPLDALNFHEAPENSTVHRGDADDWYYNNGLHFPGNDRSNTWSVAQANRDFIVNSGRGEVVGTSPMPARAALDPLAPSKAGLVPGDLIYYHDEATGTINHTAVYVGQEMQNGRLVDVVDQHANGDNNFHNDWMPDGPGFTGGSANVEFVHLHYPGE